MSDQKEELFRKIYDSFRVPGLQDVISVMVFNNGMKKVHIGDYPGIKAGYGTCLRYLDANGREKSVTGYGSVTFLGVENKCPVLSVGGETEYEKLGNFVLVKTKISLKTAETAQKRYKMSKLY